MISIKSNREIELMRKAGHIVALCHQEIKRIIKPGITTMEIENAVEKLIIDNDAIPAFKGYNGFGFCVCASPNEEVVHGMPNNKPLVEGDIISIDIGVNYKGYFGDSAWTYPVGKIDSEKQRLLTETENSLWRGLETIKAGIRLSDVSHAIEAYANKHKLGIVREMAGHGVGRQLHEAPEILNYGEPGHGPTLKVGMTLAIEPMLNLGCDEIKFGSDGWTTWTADKKASAHFEHTIVVTETGYDILTKLLEEIDETRSH